MKIARRYRVFLSMCAALFFTFAIAGHVVKPIELSSSSSLVFLNVRSWGFYSDVTYWDFAGASAEVELRAYGPIAIQSASGSEADETAQ